MDVLPDVRKPRVPLDCAVRRGELIWVWPKCGCELQPSLGEHELLLSYQIHTCVKVSQGCLILFWGKHPCHTAAVMGASAG